MKLKQWFNDTQLNIENWFQKDKLEHDFVGTKVSLLCAGLHKLIPAIPKESVVIIPLFLAITKEILVDSIIRKTVFSIEDVAWTISNSVLIYAVI